MHSGGCGLHKWRTVERIKEWTHLLVMYLGNLNFINLLSPVYWRTRHRRRRHISRGRTRCTKARQEEGLFVSTVLIALLSSYGGRWTASAHKETRQDQRQPMPRGQLKHILSCVKDKTSSERWRAYLRKWSREDPEENFRKLLGVFD